MQTAETLIRLFLGHTCHFVGFVMRQLNIPFNLPIHPSKLDETNSNCMGIWFILCLNFLKEFPVLNANSIDPAQTPYSAASTWVCAADQDLINVMRGMNGLTEII